MRPFHLSDSRWKSGGRLSGSIQSGQDMTRLTCVSEMPEQTVIVAGSPVALPKVVGKKTRRGKKGGRKHRKRLQEKLFLETLGDERVQDIRRGVEALHVACLSDVSEGAGPHLTNTSIHASQTGSAEQTPQCDSTQQQVALPDGYSATYNINEYGYHPTGCGYATDNYAYAQNGYEYANDNYGYSPYGYGYDIGSYGYAQCGYGHGSDNYGYSQYGYGYGNGSYGYAQYGHRYGY
ncbi:uncharacterized protein LOC124252896 isoform X2 [Haliotis rubra]|uniref:uncharacterized protein LOC124252896 isoform X2 n=1 Tax=Haliotis rubra TaxID=36100 RepID=UPI001EE57F17|nr:uncharacterized protein LOC124252896 isoform X2 [Haliotis rubra]